jgi:predicted phage terminase large subunit-like protein
MKTIIDSMGNLRKEAGSKSLKFFTMTYFGHYIKCRFAPFHLELFDYLTEITLKPGRQLAIAAPRGNAKSSIVSLMYVLWCICYGREKCIVLCSSTRKQSEKLLAHVKDELSSNDELKRDFPEVCEPPNPRWRSDEIVTKNDINVISSSVGHGIRGYRYKEWRPGLIVLDDVEAVEGILSQEQREKTHDWFTKVVLNLGSEKTNYIVVGTILHFDSLLARLISAEEFPGWEKRIVKSVIRFSDRQDLWDTWGQIYRGKVLYEGKEGSEAARCFFEDNRQGMLGGTEVLWPAKESYYDLMVMREQKGTASFDSEKQNEPRDTSGMSIDVNKIVFWDDRHGTLEELQEFLGPRRVVLGACDPSIGKGKKNDYSAIVTAFMDRSTKNIYVVNADVGRWNVNYPVYRICVQHEIHRFTTFAYEANAAQAWLGDIIKSAPTLIPAKPLVNLVPKDARIGKLIVYIEQGRVKLSKRLGELNRQLTQYPYGAHDDAIDALAMIIDVAENFSQFDLEQMKSVFAAIENSGSSKGSRRIISYGGHPFNDPFGLLSV